jgi:hypothetical protein
MRGPPPGFGGYEKGESNEIERGKATLGGAMGMGSRGSVLPANSAGNCYGRAKKRND